MSVGVSKTGSVRSRVTASVIAVPGRVAGAYLLKIWVRGLMWMYALALAAAYVHINPLRGFGSGGSSDRPAQCRRRFLES